MQMTIRAAVSKSIIYRGHRSRARLRLALKHLRKQRISENCQTSQVIHSWHQIQTNKWQSSCLTENSHNSTRHWSSPGWTGRILRERRIRPSQIRIGNRLCFFRTRRICTRLPGNSNSWDSNSRWPTWVLQPASSTTIDSCREKIAAQIIIGVPVSYTHLTLPTT